MLAHAVKTGELIMFGQVVQEPTKRRNDQGEPLGEREASHVAGYRHHPLLHL